MTFQTHKLLHIDLKRLGCYFMILVRAYELFTGRMLLVGEINKIYEMCVELDLIGESFALAKYKTDPNPLCQVINEFTGFNIQMHNVKHNESYNYLIGRYSMPIEEGIKRHYALVNCEGDSYIESNEVIYDSLGYGMSSKKLSG